MNGFNEPITGDRGSKFLDDGPCCYANPHKFFMSFLILKCEVVALSPCLI